MKDTRRTLPNDVARCDGAGSDAEGWRDGCESCLRRTAPRSVNRVNMMAPPPIIAFECEYFIDGNTGSTGPRADK